MATFELDPVFVKALRLLHSPAKDSADQLKTLLEDSVRLKQSGGIRLQSQGYKSDSSKINPVTSKLAALNAAKRDEFGRRELEKSSRTPEKIREETSDIKETALKRIRLTGSPKPKSGSLTPSSSPSPSAQDSDVLSDSGPEDDDVVVAQSMVDEVACVVCRELDVSSKNQLVECHGCHGLYHQECHTPPISEVEASDPRQIWYCCKCNTATKPRSGYVTPPGRESPPPRYMKKSDRGSGSDSNGSSGKIGSSSKKSSSSSKLSSKSSLSKPAPFSKLSSGKSSGKGSSSSSGSNGGSSSSKHQPSGMSSFMNADKRIQNMKKKAAAKMQGKWSHPVHIK